MTRARNRIAALSRAPRRAGVLAACMVAALALTGCEQKETGPDVTATAPAPVVAPSLPPVTAVPASQNPLADFAALDPDGDGRVSSADYARSSQALFEMIDMEHDGNLALAELQSGAAALGDIDGLTPAKLLGIADNDHDGKLTLSEWMAFNNARFDLIDRNDDGVVDSAEWDAPRAMVPPLG